MDSNIKGASCILRYIFISFFPTLFIAFITLNYFKIIDLSNINKDIFYITLFIYFIFLFFIPHNAYIAECKIKSNLNQLTNAIDSEIERTSIIINNQIKSVLNLRDFLEDYFSNIRNDNFAKIATSTFPMLGILGTFIAIATSMPDFTVTNSKELDTEISKLLSGLGTAFYASIFGIFLSLIWSFFERYGLSKIEKFVKSLETIYNKNLWLKQDLLKFQYEQKLLIENSFIQSLKEIFNLDFIKEINKEHLNSYEKIIQKTQENLKNIEKTLLDTSNILALNINKLHTTNKALEANESIEKNLEEFNRSSKELKDLLLSFDSSLDTALIKIDRELAKSVMHIENMVKILKEIK